MNNFELTFASIGLFLTFLFVLFMAGCIVRFLFGFITSKVKEYKKTHTTHIYVISFIGSCSVNKRNNKYKMTYDMSNKKEIVYAAKNISKAYEHFLSQFSYDNLIVGVKELKEV